MSTPQPSALGSVWVAVVLSRFIDGKLRHKKVKPWVPDHTAAKRSVPFTPGVGVGEGSRAWP